MKDFVENQWECFFNPDKDEIEEKCDEESAGSEDSFGDILEFEVGSAENKIDHTKMIVEMFKTTKNKQITQRKFHQQIINLWI